MNGNHHHSHGTHCGGHHHSHQEGDVKLTYAFGVNVLLSIVQVVAGIFSGSLALIADSLHNLSDAFSLFLALVARKIARKKPDAKRTYGYKKVEVLSAYTNYVILMTISVWLIFEAVMRFISPEPVMGWTVIWVSIVAVFVNLGTVALTFHDAKHSQNVRAAYLHNLGDALSSVGVLVAGILIIAFGWWWVDPLITLAISLYIMRHVWGHIPEVANILIDGNSGEDQADAIKSQILTIEGVCSLHHFHARALDEHQLAIEAHIVMEQGQVADVLRARIKSHLMEHFKIHHAFLEIEAVDCGQRGCQPE
ncbi:MAG: cation transporter [Alphaproteobacteria bacterium]|nr:cation transporter [Alphaproteobacteria bacterium]